MSLLLGRFAVRSHKGFLYFGERSRHLFRPLNIEDLRPERLNGSFQLIENVLCEPVDSCGTARARTPAASPHLSVKGRNDWQRGAVSDVDDTAARQTFEGNRLQVFAGVEGYGFGEHDENAGFFRGAKNPAHLGDEELGVVMPFGERVNINRC